MHVSHILKTNTSTNIIIILDLTFFAMVTISYVRDHPIARAILIEVFITLTNIPPNNS